MTQLIDESQQEYHTYVFSLLDEVKSTDTLGRKIPPSCYAAVLAFLDAFERGGVQLPLPFPCGDPEEPPCIYLQWRYTSMYVYDTYITFTDFKCKTHIFEGLLSDMVMTVLDLAKKNSVVGYCFKITT
jgi:hypothetical protein